MTLIHFSSPFAWSCCNHHLPPCLSYTHPPTHPLCFPNIPVLVCDCDGLSSHRNVLLSHLVPLIWREAFAPGFRLCTCTHTRRHTLQMLVRKKCVHADGVQWATYLLLARCHNKHSHSQIVPSLFPTGQSLHKVILSCVACGKNSNLNGSALNAKPALSDVLETVCQMHFCTVLYTFVKSIQWQQTTTKISLPVLLLP